MFSGSLLDRTAPFCLPRAARSPSTAPPLVGYATAAASTALPCTRTRYSTPRTCTHCTAPYSGSSNLLPAHCAFTHAVLVTHCRTSPACSGSRVLLHRLRTAHTALLPALLKVTMPTACQLTTMGCWFGIRTFCSAHPPDFLCYLWIWIAPHTLPRLVFTALHCYPAVLWTSLGSTPACSHLLPLDSIPACFPFTVPY